MMESVPEVCMSEKACGGFLGCGLVCAFPVYKWWKSLSVETRVKIPLILSAIIGTADSVLDWIVLSDWYATGLWRIATALLLCILIAGFMLIVFGVKSLEEYTFGYKFMCLTMMLFGLGNILLAFFVAQRSPINEEMYFAFYSGRSFEVFVEAAPGKFIEMFDRIILWVFSTSDFLFRVLSIVFFLKEYRWAEFVLVPMIFIYEAVIWYAGWWYSNKYTGVVKTLDTWNMVLICVPAMVFAIPSVCTCSLPLSMLGYPFLRRHFLKHFLSRFFLSCILYGISISSSGMDNWSYIILSLSILSLIGAIRLRQVLSSEGKALSLNSDLLKLKLKEKNADFFTTWAGQGNCRMVKQTLFSGVVEVDIHDSAGKTAFLAAARPWILRHSQRLRGNAEVVTFLIDAKCNVDAQFKDGETALHLAARKGCSEVVTVLIDAKCNVDAQDGGATTALHKAAIKGHSEVVSLLIDAKCNVDLRCKGKTALHFAATFGHSEVVSLLIDAKFNVDLEDDEQNTALHLAAKKGQSEVITLLIDAKCNVDAEDDLGMTALHRAAFNGHSEAVVLLIDAKCNVDAEAILGRTALHLAAEKGHSEVASLLIDAKCNVDAEDTLERTALHFAVEEGHSEVVTLLDSRHKMQRLITSTLVPKYETHPG